MKKQFFIFFCFVFCGLFNASAFGDNVCSSKSLTNWAPNKGNIDAFFECDSFSDGEKSPFKVAINWGPGVKTAVRNPDTDNETLTSISGYAGNPDAVRAILEKKPNAAKDYQNTENKSALKEVIDHCCYAAGSGYSNKTSEIVQILIDKDPSLKDERFNMSFSDFSSSKYVNIKDGTLLDYVRLWQEMGAYCPKSANKEQCKKIEEILKKAGVQTAEELGPVVKNTDNQVSTVVPEVAAAETGNNQTEVLTPSPNVDVANPASEDEANTQMDLKNIQPVSILSGVPQEKLEMPAEINIDAPIQLNNESKLDEEKKKALAEKQKAYDDAKAKEQSTANKLLGGLTTAATGIGGMQLMQGLAEQSSDKDAAADMAAYIETMRCTYGDGQQVKAGFDEIELPGANDAELMNLRGEYLALAADLKERKTALGMKPGIESETIMDRASTGLYDDENIGITSGNYVSLYRAQALKSEAAQQKIDDAKNTSGNRVKYGATAAGAGAAVGITGDSLINGKLGDLLKSKDSEEK